MSDIEAIAVVNLHQEATELLALFITISKKSKKNNKT